MEQVTNIQKSTRQKMNFKKIETLLEKANKESQKAIDAIFKKYDAEMNALIAEQIPTGHSIRFGNGMSILYDKNGKQVTSGRAWGINTNGEDDELNQLSVLQYQSEFHAGFEIKDKIKSTKV